MSNAPEGLSPWSDEAAVRAHFVETALRDTRDGGFLPPLDSYLGRFPGYEHVVHEEYERLASPAPSASEGDPPVFGSPRAIGGYEIVSEIGRGAQGVVYRAIDSSGTIVAIKILRRIPDDDVDGVRRFRREARIAARLDHPAICPVLRSGVDHGRPYFVMRHIDGAALSQRVRDNRRHVLLFPDWSKWVEHLRDVAALLSPVAEALHVAHEAGIVHRDVSPNNILTDRDGRPYLVDFGLARSLRDETAQITENGVPLGTPAYAAPELRAGNGASADRRADVFSLGAVLMELAAIRVPSELDRRGLHSPPVLANDGPVPAPWREFRAVCARATAADRENRFATAALLARDLRALAEGRRPDAQRRILRRASDFVRAEPLLAGLIAAVIFGLAIGLVVFGRLTANANREALQASLERQRADARSARTAQLLAFEELRAGRAPEARARIAAVLPKYRGFETQHLDFAADSALARLPGPVDGTLIAPSTGPRWCGFDGRAARLTRDGPVQDVPARAGVLVDAGTTPGGDWFRVMLATNAVHIDVFSGARVTRTVELSDPDAGYRRWTVADEGRAVWCVDADGIVQRADTSTIAPASRKKASDWRIILRAGVVIAVATDSLGAVWQVRDPADPSPRSPTRDQAGRLVDITRDATGQRLVVLRVDPFAARSARVEILDASSFALLATRTIPSCPDARCVRLDHDGVAWVGVADGSLRRVEIGGWAEITSYFGHTAAIREIIPDGGLIATRSTDGTLQWWDPAGSATVKLWNDAESIRAIRVGADERVHTSSSNHALSELDLTTRTWVRRAGAGDHDPIAIDPDGCPWWIVGGRAFKATGSGIAACAWSAGEATHVNAVPHPSAARVVTQSRTPGGARSPLMVFDRDAAGPSLSSLPGFDETLYELRSDPAARILVAQGPQSIVAWRADDPSHVAVRMSAEKLADFDVSPDAATIVGLYRDGRLELVPIDGVPGRSWQAGPQGLSVRWSPDGTRIATGLGDHSVVLWDPVHQEQVLSLGDLDFEPVNLAWSPSGDRLVAAATTGRLQVWETIRVKERLWGAAAARAPLATNPPQLDPPTLVVLGATSLHTTPRGTVPRLQTTLAELAFPPLLGRCWYEMVAATAACVVERTPGALDPMAARVVALTRLGTLEEADREMAVLAATARGVRLPPDLSSVIQATAAFHAECRNHRSAENPIAPQGSPLSDEISLRAGIDGLSAELQGIEPTWDSVSAARPPDDVLVAAARPEHRDALRAIARSRVRPPRAAMFFAWAIAVCPGRPTSEIEAARRWIDERSEEPDVSAELVSAALSIREGNAVALPILRRLDGDRLAGDPRFDPIACAFRAMGEAMTGDSSAARSAALRLLTMSESDPGCRDPVVRSLVAETAPLISDRK